MPAHNAGEKAGLSVGLVFAVALFGVSYWLARGGTQDLDRWVSKIRRPAGHGWTQLTGLDGAIELERVNGTANGTATAPARNTAHGTTHATADDTATGAASGTAAGTADGTALDENNITARSAASGPR